MLRGGGVMTIHPRKNPILTPTKSLPDVILETQSKSNTRNNKNMCIFCSLFLDKWGGLNQMENLEKHLF